MSEAFDATKLEWQGLNPSFFRTC